MTRHLRAFASWLGERRPFDFIIDGPNVAYHNQNYEGGGFRYGQIQLVIEALRRAHGPDVRVLVLLPSKCIALTLTLTLALAPTPTLEPLPRPSCCLPSKCRAPLHLCVFSRRGDFGRRALLRRGTCERTSREPTA